MSTQIRLRAPTDRGIRQGYLGYSAGAPFAIDRDDIPSIRSAFQQGAYDPSGVFTIADFPEPPPASSTATPAIAFDKRLCIRAIHCLKLSDVTLGPGEEGYVFGHEIQGLPAGSFEFVDEKETPAIARRASGDLESEHARKAALLATSQRQLDDTAATVRDIALVERAAAARVHRGDKTAAKDRDAAKHALESAREAHHAAQAAHDEERAVLEPQIAALAAAIPIAQEREERDRLEAEHNAKKERYFASFCRMWKLVHGLRAEIREQELAATDLGRNDIVHRDVLEPIATRLFLENPIVRRAVEARERATAESEADAS